MDHGDCEPNNDDQRRKNPTKEDVEGGFPPCSNGVVGN